MLGSEASAELRDRLLGELNDFASSDDAAIWAHRCLVEKNRLTEADAQCVEEAFQVRLAPFVTGAGDVSQTPGDAEQLSIPHSPHPNEPKKRSRPTVINKSVLALPEPRRVRDRDHVRYVAKQPCLVCDRRPSDAHHLRFAQSRALGRKVSDEFTVPLCRGHHREVHRSDDEAAWWRKAGIDPMPRARALWLKTHPLLTTNKTDIKGATSSATIGSNQRIAKPDRPVRRRGSNYKTKPIVAAVDPR